MFPSAMEARSRLFTLYPSIPEKLEMALLCPMSDHRGISLSQTQAPKSKPSQIRYARYVKYAMLRIPTSIIVFVCQPIYSRSSL
jgi:hypothetical protein